MKYIRTKDDIYELCEKQGNNKGFYNVKIPPLLRKFLLDDSENGYKVVAKNRVIKQADTIEELCDGLIVEDKDNTNNWFVMEISEYQSKDNLDKKYMVDRWNFCAFIKTDKGLIYVAKMNDKGELELL